MSAMMPIHIQQSAPRYIGQWTYCAENVTSCEKNINNDAMDYNNNAKFTKLYKGTIILAQQTKINYGIHSG